MHATHCHCISWMETHHHPPHRSVHRIATNINARHTLSLHQLDGNTPPPSTHHRSVHRHHDDGSSQHAIIASSSDLGWMLFYSVSYSVRAGFCVLHRQSKMETHHHRIIIAGGSWVHRDHPYLHQYLS